MSSDADGFAPPTYDLRVLGDGDEHAIGARLARYVDRFLALAAAEVGAAFAPVPEFAARAAAERGREAEWYRATTRERYFLELAATLVMNRQL